MTAYSKTPLIKKLGITEGMEIAFINTPKDYVQLLGPLPIKTRVQTTLSADYDLIHFFTRSQVSLKELFPMLKASLKKTGMLWISWPKSSCSFASSDLTENTVRAIGLDNGLVDVKIAAIDEEWSGLKFVYRLTDR